MNIIDTVPRCSKCGLTHTSAECSVFYLVNRETHAQQSQIVITGGFVPTPDQLRIMELEAQVRRLQDELAQEKHDHANARAAAHMLMERIKCGNELKTSSTGSFPSPSSQPSSSSQSPSSGS